ncbi:MAG: hypothetical protein SV375_20285 [Thermodesulfobacteriota bacterium]|nr:hypothetical protein [Thermodesulfobacteriota bacterium]
MNVELEDFKTGWYGIYIGIKHEEIDVLIERLRSLKRDKDQHFHISSDYGGSGGVGDIEFSIQGDNEESNMIIT